VQLGVPAIAFSGAGSSQHIYTEPDAASNVYAQVSLKLVNAVIASGEPYLPAGVALVRFIVYSLYICSPDDFFLIGALECQLPESHLEHMLQALRLFVRSHPNLRQFKRYRCHSVWYKPFAY
jgi:hypothetical protein